jgi:hypothetical protein
LTLHSIKKYKKMAKDIIDVIHVSEEIRDTTTVGENTATRVGTNLVDLGENIQALQIALNNKVDDSQVLTNVPANALFTDTVYDDSWIQLALDDKVDDSQVLTDVPANALFTDTVYDDTPINTALKERTVWQGEWVSGITYKKNDQVADGGWLAIANKETTERPAPQENGNSESTIDESAIVFSQESEVAHINAGHMYTFTQAGWVNRIRVYVTGVSDTVKYLFKYEDTTDFNNIIRKTVYIPHLENDTWLDVFVGNTIVKKGTKVKVYLDLLESVSSTVLNGQWTRENNGSGADVPPGGWYEWANYIYFSIFDADGVNRRDDLMQGVIGTTFTITQADNPDKFSKYRIEADPVELEGVHVVYNVTIIEGGAEGAPDINALCNSTSDIPVVATTHYVESADYISNNPVSFANIMGYLKFDGVTQPGHDNNAFGINLEFQPAYVSPDWDLQSNAATSNAVTTRATVETKKNIIQSGSTILRPAINLVVGQQYIDTDINKILWYDGVVWRDAMGNII